MSGMFLSVAIENADFVIPRGIRELSTGLPNHRHIHQLCTYFRQRGVASLPLTGTPDTYHVNAMQSAAAFIFELRRAPDDSKVTSFARPLFDAISSGYWDAAIEMATLSRTTWNPDYEYEDDFLYVRFWMQQLLGEPRDQLDATLARYEQVLSGARDVRLDLCRAIHDIDDDGFDIALRTLLDQRRAEVDDLERREALKADTAAWIQHFALEGVALLKLAGRLGVVAGFDYPHCPELLRPDSPFAFDSRAWMQASFVPRRRVTT